MNLYKDGKYLPEIKSLGKNKQKYVFPAEKLRWPNKIRVKKSAEAFYCAACSVRIKSISSQKGLVIQHEIYGT